MIAAKNIPESTVFDYDDIGPDDIGQCDIAFLGHSCRCHTCDFSS